VIPDINGAAFAAGALQKLKGLDPSSLPARLRARASAPASATCATSSRSACNYADHAAETGAPIPAEPIVFNKAPSCIVGPNDDVVLPRGSLKTTGKWSSPS
jgi:2-keto-4-pentenoate hydratase/2-oxohepta-3-ene-1,7-dioic acid hydratase in catechol pathway